MGKKLTITGKVLRFAFKAAVLAVRGLSVVALLVGVTAYKWLSGADWRHGYNGRRLVTRPVRAAGQTLAVVIILALIWNPAITATALAVTGGSLVGTAFVTRHIAARRALPPRGGPIRVRATVGTPRHLKGRP